MTSGFGWNTYGLSGGRKIANLAQDIEDVDPDTLACEARVSEPMRDMMRVLLGRSQCHISVSDALDFLRDVPDESVDAVVMDPPFGLGKKYAEGREAADSAEAYWRWFEPFYREAMRALKPGGFCAVWQAGPYLKHAWSWFGDSIHVYAGCKNFVQLRPTAINYAWDPIVMFYKEGAKALRPEKPPRSVDFFVANTAGVISDTTRIEKAHPFPRPLDLATQIVQNFVVPGGVILDPFVGSGTSAVAAVSTGRRFIGCDESRDYVENIALRRVEKALTEGVSA